MWITEYDKSKLPSRGFKMCKLQGILEEFINSDFDCVKIEGWDYKNIKSCAGSFSNSIKRFGFRNVRVVTRKGEVFLIKTQGGNKE